MEQPLEFEEPGKEDWAWVIQHGLYGMKQSGHIWNITQSFTVPHLFLQESSHSSGIVMESKRIHRNSAGIPLE